MPAVDLAVDKGLELLAQLGPWVKEFDRAMRSGATSFSLRNETYGSVDAETLYALVRHTRPAQVVELGSGSSSHVIDTARRRNEDDGFPFEHRVFDPYPWEATVLGRVEGATVLPLGARAVDVSEFDALGRDDILFVDTTHTVKTGGDVNRIVLDILPRLAPGVLVHFHDIFLPYEYPRSWVVTERRAWAEQYLLQAFLAFNSGYEVALPTHALSRMHPASVRRLVPSFGPGVAPGAFWMRRADRQAG